MRKQSILIWAIFAALFFPSFAHSDYWVDRHGTLSPNGDLPKGTRYQPSFNLNLGDTQLLWKADQLQTRKNFATATSPTIANSTVFATMDNTLYAWDLNTGAVKPGYPIALTTAAGMTSPILANGIVYAGTGAAIYAWTQDKGVLVKGFPVTLNGTVWAPPLVLSGLLYEPCSDSKIYAWNCQTGGLLSGFPVSTGNVSSMPLDAASLTTPGGILSLVFQTSLDGRVYGWPLGLPVTATGFPLNTGKSFNASPVIYHGCLYAATVDGRLYGWNLLTGNPVAGFPLTLTAGSFSCPAIANGNIYVGTLDNKVFGFNIASGSLLQGFPVSVKGSISCSPAVANNVVYIGDSTNTLYAISAVNGQVLWSYAIPVVVDKAGFNLSSPALADNRVVVLSASAKGLYVFGDPRQPTSTLTPSVTPTATATTTPTPSLLAICMSRPCGSRTTSATLTLTSSPTSTATVTPTLTPVIAALDVQNVIAYPNPFKTGDIINLSYVLPTSDTDKVTIKIYTISALLIRVLDGCPANYGLNACPWDIKDLKGIGLSNGIYYFSVEAVRGNSKVTHIGKIAITR